MSSPRVPIYLPGGATRRDTTPEYVASMGTPDAHGMCEVTHWRDDSSWTKCHHGIRLRVRLPTAWALSQLDALQVLVNEHDDRVERAILSREPVPSLGVEWAKKQVKARGWTVRLVQRIDAYGAAIVDEEPMALREGRPVYKKFRLERVEVPRFSAELVLDHAAIRSRVDGEGFDPLDPALFDNYIDVVELMQGLMGSDYDSDEISEEYLDDSEEEEEDTEVEEDQEPHLEHRSEHEGSQ